ncbi:MAG: multidrug transporter [Chloroflexota bacterium]|nr:multidrug transporter [Chloroflexota bacterium]
MQRFIIEDTRHIPPFNQPASQLTIGTQPLKLLQENVILAAYGAGLPIGGTLSSADQIAGVRGAALVYRDNLYFDLPFLQEFLTRARKSGRACRAAFSPDDPAFRTYSLPLSRAYAHGSDPVSGVPLHLADLWYFPDGYTPDVTPIVIDSGAQEMGFYSVPDFMTMEQGSLTHYGIERGIIAIESWVHVYFASIIFGLFGRASQVDRRAATHNLFSLKLLWRAVLEQRQILSSSAVVQIGKNSRIHPTAVITGPASIGDNCSIGPGVFLDNCTIGDNVTIDDGCVLMFSAIGNGTFLPFRAALYLTAVMENAIIAQNTCLQMCVIGRNSFVGAGSTFTDFNLIEQRPIRAANLSGQLEEVGQIVLGSAVGHNCRIGSGMVMFPGRMIESDVVLVASPQRRVISRNVAYEESDHHTVGSRTAHRRHYPRRDETEATEQSW